MKNLLAPTNNLGFTCGPQEKSNCPPLHQAFLLFTLWALNGQSQQTDAQTHKKFHIVNVWMIN